MQISQFTATSNNSDLDISTNYADTNSDQSSLINSRIRKSEINLENFKNKLIYLDSDGMMTKNQEKQGFEHGALIESCIKEFSEEIDTALKRQG